MIVGIDEACPSELALDDFELHGGGAELAGHVQRCRPCRQRMTERQAGRAQFDAGAGALWTRIAATTQERRRHRRDRRWTLFGLLAPGAVAGVVALWLSTSRPALHDPVPKGHADTPTSPLEILCRRSDRVIVLAPGAIVAGGDELVFRPLTVWPDARFIQIGSVDGTTRYTPFYPSVLGAPSVPLPTAGSPLDGAIRLDTAPGPERIFVVLTATPVSETSVRSIAERTWRTAATVDRVDGVSAWTGWVVLLKGAGSPAGRARAP